VPGCRDSALNCHTDGHPFHLGVVGYIDDVPPGGGSFMELRQAVLYDFHKADMAQTKLKPPQQDMWRDWSNEIHAIDIEEELWMIKTRSPTTTAAANFFCRAPYSTR
jgi:hypothetical protein